MHINNTFLSEMRGFFFINPISAQKNKIMFCDLKFTDMSHDDHKYRNM
jgi:hypothetical protein